MELSDEVRRIIKQLKALEKMWPKGGLMLMVNGNGLYLCTKHPEAGGRALEHFNIASDGGDPEWKGDSNP